MTDPWTTPRDPWLARAGPASRGRAVPGRPADRPPVREPAARRPRRARADRRRVRARATCCTATPSGWRSACPSPGAGAHGGGAAAQLPAAADPGGAAGAAGVRRRAPLTAGTRPVRCLRWGTVPSAREQLIEYIKSDAVFHGDFTLTSGKKATFYVDLRKVSLDHRVAPLIGQVMLDLIADVPDVAAVGGLTMGADPIATSILHQGAARGVGDRRVRRPQGAEGPRPRPPGRGPRGRRQARDRGRGHLHHRRLPAEGDRGAREGRRGDRRPSRSSSTGARAPRRSSRPAGYPYLAALDLTDLGPRLSMPLAA